MFPRRSVQHRVPRAAGRSHRLARGPDALDLIVVTDTAAASLLPKGLPLDVPLMVIDHHAASSRSVTSSCERSRLLPPARSCSASSTRSGSPTFPCSDRRAHLCGVVADTGGFRYSSTNATTMRIGARLIEGGADP